MSILIKTTEEIEKMRIAGRLTAQVLEALHDVVQPGITTMDIDTFCEKYIVETLGAKPGSKGQYGYPYTVNTSLNHVICHGMPSEHKKLKSGDIVNVDITVIYEGYYGDSSYMFCVGNVAPHAKRLVDITQECLYKGILTAGQKNSTLGDIGHTIQQHAEKNNYSVVREYCGHGIGAKMHESPNVLHYGKPQTGMQLKPGMIFTIEPMINQGKKNIKLIKKNGWDIAITKDKRLSAQWEHTNLITENGIEVLTIRKDEDKLRELLKTINNA